MATQSVTWKTPLPERFAIQVDHAANGCWLWKGGKTGRRGQKYGVIWVRGQETAAHRASYELHVGPIPDGLCVLHRCDTPLCVNPDHLFLGTLSDNQKDAVAKKRHHESRKTHCPRGHLLSGDNLWVTPNGKKRRCRACDRENQRRRKGVKRP